MGKRVAILGGGVAGLSAAHELVERGFEVVVYDKHHVPGGKARSFPKLGTATDGRLDLPAEHGFRFFPGFYKHLPDTMQRIPFANQPNGVFDNLVEATRMRWLVRARRRSSCRRASRNRCRTSPPDSSDSCSEPSRHPATRTAPLCRPPADLRRRAVTSVGSKSTSTRAGGTSSAPPSAPLPISASWRSA